MPAFAEEPRTSVRRGAITASLLLHAAVIAALLHWWRASPPPEPRIPPVAIVIEGPGRAGEAGGNNSGQGPAPAAAAGSAEVAAPEAAPPPPQEAAPPVATPPAPPVAAAPAAPAPLPPPKPTLAAAAPPPLPARKPHPHRPHLEPPQPLAPPVPQVVAAASPASVPAPVPAPAPAAPAAAGVSGTPGPADRHGLGEAGTGQGVIGDGPRDGPGDDYLEALRRWLARHKRYPQEALDKKEEGEVVVGFTLSRDGTVLAAWIEQSSGVAILDRAALAMLHEASPVPPVPARYKGSELTLAMPIDYSIGFFDKLFR